MQSIFHRTKIHTEHSPLNTNPFDDLVHTISEIFQRELINIENYSIGCMGLYPKKKQETFHTRVKETLTNPFAERIRTITEKIDAQKTFIEKLQHDNHHELKTAVHGIVHSSSDSLESLQEIQTLSENLLELLETNKRIYEEVIEFIETELDLNELSIELISLGNPKSDYQDRYFYLTRKKTDQTYIEKITNLRIQIEEILHDRIEDINPELRKYIERLSLELNENIRSIEQLMLQNTDEIRETLSLIAKIAKTLKSNGASSDPRQKEKLTALTEHLLRLLHEGSNFHKAVAGTIALEKKQFSLSDLLKRIKDEYELTQHRTIDLHFHTTGTVPLLIGDEGQIKTVIENILFAILHSGKEGQVNIHIQSTPTAEKRIRLHFTLEDSSSFPERSVGQIFSTLDGLEKSIERRRFITDKLLEKMEGELSLALESEENTISSFHMTLEKQASSIMSPEKPLSIEEAIERLKEKKILVVDDSSVNRKILR